MGFLEGGDTSRAGGLLGRRVGLGEATPLGWVVLFGLRAVTQKAIHGVMSFGVWGCPVGLGFLLGAGGDTSGAWGCVEEDPGLFRGGGVGGFLGKSGSFGGALRVGPSHLGRGGAKIEGHGGNNTRG